MADILILDIIAFREDNEVKHMVPYQLGAEFHCTAAYGKDPHWDEGGLKRCLREIAETAGGLTDEQWKTLESLLVIRHFAYMSRGENGAGQPYPLKTRP